MECHKGLERCSSVSNSYSLGRPPNCFLLLEFQLFMQGPGTRSGWVCIWRLFFFVVFLTRGQGLTPSKSFPQSFTQTCVNCVTHLAHFANVTNVHWQGLLRLYRERVRGARCGHCCESQSLWGTSSGGAFFGTPDWCLGNSAWTVGPVGLVSKCSWQPI